MFAPHDWFCHAANALFLASYSMTEQWKLRACALVAQSTAMGYYVILALWAPMIWNLLFMTINVARLVKLYRVSRQDAPQATTSGDPLPDSGSA